MSKLMWDLTGSRFYEIGADRGVLYRNGVGVAWSGLISVNEEPESDEQASVFLDGVAQHIVSAPDDLKLNISAYTYPDEFAECQGTSEIDGVLVDEQPPVPFDLSYRTLIGSDTDPELGYKIHLVYGCLATPSDHDYSTLGESNDPTAFEWDASTMAPERIPGFRASAHLIVDTRLIGNPLLLSQFEELLYGTDAELPTLPSPAEVAFWFQDWWYLRITDNGDGTWTADGPDELFSTPGLDQFAINYPSAVYIDADTYTIESSL